MIHCRSTLEKPRACCADGSAMFMIVMSSTIISWASPITARISQPRRSGSADEVTGPPPGTLGALGAAISVSHLEIQTPFMPSTITEVEAMNPLWSRMSIMDSATESDRPLRKDAERNRQRILAAASAVFTQRGLEGTLDGVGR